MSRLVSSALYLSIALLMLSAGFELAAISSMVYWLHYRAGKDFLINYQGSTFSLHGKPAGLLVDQGHTSNGAAGTAFVCVGLGGILALYLRNRAARQGKPLRGFAGFMYHFWLTFTVLSMLLGLAALIYTMILTYDHDNQTIDIAKASTLNNHPYPNYVAYPYLQWTPENWFTAVLALPLHSKSDRDDIHTHLELMKGWRWNLIPLFVLGLIVCVLAVVDALGYRRRARESRGFGMYADKRVSA